MKCIKCGNDITEDNAVNCPSCGDKIHKDKFPIWAIVLIILTPLLFGLILTVLTTMAVWYTIKYEQAFQDTYTYLNTKERIENFNNTKTLTLKLKNGVEVKSERLVDFCERTLPSDIKYFTKEHACGTIIVDIDGFGKGLDLRTEGDDLFELYDQFNLIFFKDRIVPEYKTPEAKILKHVLISIP